MHLGKSYYLFLTTFYEQNIWRWYESILGMLVTTKFTVKLVIGSNRRLWVILNVTCALKWQFCYDLLIYTRFLLHLWNTTVHCFRHKTLDHLSSYPTYKTVQQDIESKAGHTEVLQLLNWLQRNTILWSFQVQIILHDRLHWLVYMYRVVWKH